LTTWDEAGTKSGKFFIKQFSREMPIGAGSQTLHPLSDSIYSQSIMRNPITTPTISTWGMLVVLLFISQISRAELVLDPALGTVIATGPADPGFDFSVLLPDTETFAGRFFGQAVTGPIYAVDNGNINFTSDTLFFPNSDNTVARISPLWDDFLFDATTNNRLIYQRQVGNYLAVTWQNVRLSNETAFNAGIFPDTDRALQAIWFEADTAIRGFDFTKDDIVFSYIAHQSGTSNFGPIEGQVSLDRGDGPSTAILPGTLDGSVTQADGALFPWQENRFLLFRWNDNTNLYWVSTESFTAVPEPSSAFALLAMSTLGGWLERRRRKNVQAKSVTPVI